MATFIEGPPYHYNIYFYPPGFEFSSVIDLFGLIG